MAFLVGALLNKKTCMNGFISFDSSEGSECFVCEMYI